MIKKPLIFPLVIFLTTIISSTLPAAAGTDQSDLSKICILGEKGDAWANSLKKLYPSAPILTMSYSDFIKQSQLKEKSRHSLIILNSGILSSDLAEPQLKQFRKSIENYIAGGGRLIAVKDSIYIRDEKQESTRFFMNEYLRAGMATFNFSILYPCFPPKSWPQADPATLYKAGHKSVQAGTDGIFIFSYINMRLNENHGNLSSNSSGKNEKTENKLAPIIRKIFSELECNNAKSDKLMPYGLPLHPKGLFVKKWVAGNTRYKSSPEEIVAYASSLKANVLCVEILPPAYLKRLTELANRSGIQIWLATGIGENKLSTWTNKSSCKLDEAEKQILNNGKIINSPCPLAARNNFMPKFLEQLQHIIKKNPEIKVLTIDEFALEAKGWTEWGCFCSECQSLFEKLYGKKLTQKNVCIGKNISKDFKEFRIHVMTEYFIKPLKKMLNKVNPNIQLGLWCQNGQLYWLTGYNMEKSTSAGLTLYGPEIVGENCKSLKRGKKFPLTEFKFKEMAYTDKMSDMTDSKTTEGAAIKVDVFNGAEVLAWLISDDEMRYPGIVSTNQSRTLYLAFDPLELSETEKHKFIKNILSFLFRM